MDEIEVVIKIPKILYAQIQSDAEIMIYSGMRSWKGVLATLLRSVRNGTPLPKGHGRLIDADKLKDQIIEVKLENVSRDIRVITGCQLEESPTILEADEGVREE